MNNGIYGLTSAEFDTQRYFKWLHRVDRLTWEMAGLSIHDLPDMPLRDWFDEGMPPLTAARKAVRISKQESGF